MTSQFYERRRSTGSESRSKIDVDGSSEQTSCDDGDARRALDEIELIHLRLLAEMSDVDEDVVNERRFFDVRQSIRSLDDGLQEDSSTFQNFVESENEESEEDVIRRCRSFGCLMSTNRFVDENFLQYSDDRRRSRSSCFLNIPDSFSSEETR